MRCIDLDLSRLHLLNMHEFPSDMSSARPSSGSPSSGPSLSRFLTTLAQTQRQVDELRLQCANFIILTIIFLSKFDHAARLDQVVDHLVSRSQWTRAQAYVYLMDESIRWLESIDGVSWGAMTLSADMISQQCRLRSNRTHRQLLMTTSFTWPSDANIVAGGRRHAIAVLRSKSWIS